MAHKIDSKIIKGHQKIAVIIIITEDYYDLRDYDIGSLGHIDVFWGQK